MNISGIRGETTFTGRVAANDTTQKRITTIGASAVNPFVKPDVNHPLSLKHSGQLAPPLSKGMAALINTLF